MSTGSRQSPPHLSVTISLSAVLTGPGWKEAHWGQAGGEGEAAGASEWPRRADGHRELAGPGAQGPVRWAALWALGTSAWGPMGTLPVLNSYLRRKPRNFSSVRKTKRQNSWVGLRLVHDI